MKTYTLLIVDDEPHHLQIIADTLRNVDLDIKIIRAPNGKIALELAKKKKPDLIISDWDMPEMNGIELVKALKALPLTHDIPVIMCSGVMTSSENLDTALQAGAIDYIRKPIDKPELIARSRSMLKLSDSIKKIKALSETKDKFFSIIAHDLKNPFNSLLGFAELLKELHVSYNIEKRAEIIDIILTSAKNLYQLVENLLAWSLAQKENIQVKSEVFMASLTIQQTVQLYEQMALKKQITLIYKPLQEVSINADRKMFETILRNLLSNALKFTPSGGNITVVSDKKDNAAFFSVSDSGVGISPDAIETIFLPEGNISSRGTENEAGSGLGLMLCKEFVDKNNGHIGVESTWGKGSTFWFTMPLAEN